MVGRRGAIATLALIGLIAWAGHAAASGPSPTEPWYIDQYGGDRADVLRFYDGRLGIVMPTAPRPMRYIAWRLLHGQTVGERAGDALSTPCCGASWWEFDDSAGVQGWLKARSAVDGEQGSAWLATERLGPDHTSVVNCFPDAFDVAGATLKDRAARYGAQSAAVKSPTRNSREPGEASCE